MIEEHSEPGITILCAIVYPDKPSVTGSRTVRNPVIWQGLVEFSFGAV